MIISRIFILALSLENGANLSGHCGSFITCKISNLTFANVRHISRSDRVLGVNRSHNFDVLGHFKTASSIHQTPMLCDAGVSRDFRHSHVTEA